MANIRIKDLTTTAATTASDDFIAVDGATNGTRKLSAYSPTFGGNLTVNGTASAGTLTDGYITVSAAQINRGAGQPVELQYAGAGGVRMFGNTATPITFSSTGNLTVSGTGTSSVAGDFGVGTATPAGRLQVISGSSPNAAQVIIGYGGSNNFFDANDNIFRNGSFTESMRLKSTGNLLLGTTTDSGNGKLQLATHSTSAGGIGFGTDTSLYRTAAGNLAVYGTATDLRINFSHSTSTAGKGFDIQLDSLKDAYVWQRENRNLYFGTNNTTALTLDSSQNATFAGKVVVSGTGIAMGGATNPAVQGVYTAGLSTYFLANSGGNVNLGNASNGSLVVINSSGDITMTSGAALKLGNAYIAGAPTATGYVTIKDSAGVTYKVLVST